MAAYIVTFTYSDSVYVEDAENPADALGQAKRQAEPGWDDWDWEEVDEEDRP